MRYSTTNYAAETTIGVSNVVNETLGASNMVDTRTTRAYVADQDTASDVVISFDLEVGGTQQERDVDFVALVGTTAIEQVTVTLKYLTSTVATQVVDLQTPIQQNYLVAAFDSVGADEVEISFNVGAGEQFSVGYLYVGELADPLKIESLNYSVNSADPRSITRAGTSLTSSTYLFATLSITVSEETFSTLRARAVDLASVGFAVPRLWYFDGTCESCILTGEALYGILDADILQLDPSYFPGGEAKAQLTLGLRETN